VEGSGSSLLCGILPAIMGMSLGRRHLEEREVDGIHRVRSNGGRLLG
jgi:hypothetical protein